MKKSKTGFCFSPLMANNFNLFIKSIEPSSIIEAVYSEEFIRKTKNSIVAALNNKNTKFSIEDIENFMLIAKKINKEDIKVEIEIISINVVTSRFGNWENKGADIVIKYRNNDPKDGKKYNYSNTIHITFDHINK